MGIPARILRRFIAPYRFNTPPKPYGQVREMSNTGASPMRGCVTPDATRRSGRPPPSLVRADFAILRRAMAGTTPTTVPLVIRQLDDWVDPARAIDAIARQPLPAILDSTDPHIAGPRHAVLACRPARVITADATLHHDPFAALADGLRAVRLDRPPGVPYVPGWRATIGALSSKGLRHLIKLPSYVSVLLKHDHPRLHGPYVRFFQVPVGRFVLRHLYR